MDGFKYVHRLSYGRLPVTYGFPLTPEHELYDPSADPGESNNMADSHPEKVKIFGNFIQSIFPEGKPAREATDRGGE